MEGPLKEAHCGRLNAAVIWGLNRCDTRHLGILNRIDLKSEYSLLKIRILYRIL
jgi:hypothetical protein